MNNHIGAKSRARQSTATSTHKHVHATGSDKYALIITTAPTRQIQFPMPWYSLWDHWCRAAASCICLCLHARKKVLVMQITGVAITSLSEQVQLTQRVDDMHAASRNYFASLEHSHIFKSVPRVRHGWREAKHF